MGFFFQIFIEFTNNFVVQGNANDTNYEYRYSVTVNIGADLLVVKYYSDNLT